VTTNFRISSKMLVEQSLANLQDTVTRMADLQDEASSLKRLRRPSDAPADVVSAMSLHADLGRNDQISRNIDDASAWLGTADSALQSVVTQLQKVHDLVIQSQNPALDDSSRASIAAQIDSLRTGILAAANTQYAGRPIFGGTVGGGQAYDASGNYVGVSAAVERTISPGQRVQVNVNGDAVFGSPGSDLFTTLTQLSSAVANGDTSQLGVLTTTLDTQTNSVQKGLAEVGARFQRVDSMKNQNSADALTMKKNLSNIEDADLAQVMMNLQTQQIAYQAALSATARAIQPSLADFLR
jgi:flagellar hook-associated protein 3 FlgL